MQNINQKRSEKELIKENLMLVKKNKYLVDRILAFRSEFERISVGDKNGSYVLISSILTDEGTPRPNALEAALDIEKSTNGREWALAKDLVRLLASISSEQTERLIYLQSANNNSVVRDSYKRWFKELKQWPWYKRLFLIDV